MRKNPVPSPAVSRGCGFPFPKQVAKRHLRGSFQPVGRIKWEIYISWSLYYWWFDSNGRVRSTSINNIWFNIDRSNFSGNPWCFCPVQPIPNLLNDARLSKGLPSLGFLNPLLYSVGVSGFNDITVGNNPGCGTPGFNVCSPIHWSWRGCKLMQYYS